MSYTIGEVKKILSSAAIEDLKEVMKNFEADERAGVQNELKKAAVRITKYEQELQRTYAISEYERKYSDYAYIC